MTVVNWLLSRLSEDKDGIVELNVLFESFKFEMIESGINTNYSKRIFVDHLQKLFPSAERVRTKVASRATTITKFSGIRIKQLNEIPPSNLTSQTIRDLLPDYVVGVEINPSNVKCCVHTNCYCDGNEVLKTITFYCDGHWKMNISGKDVELNNLYVSDKYVPTEDGLNVIMKCVKHLKLCEGITMNHSVIVSRYHKLNNWKIEDRDSRLLHSIMCNKLVTMTSVSGTCTKCLKMTFNSDNNKDNNKENIPIPNDAKNDESSGNSSKQNQKVTEENIQNLFPGAPKEMQELLRDQAKNVCRVPHGRRWSQNVIVLCLKWYCRSPQSYEAVRDSKYILLPSRSVLIRYKTKVKHTVGFDSDLFLWMNEEAKRQNVPEGGYVGGLIIDEMSIQADIQIHESGDVVELTGLVDIGEEGNIAHALRQGSNEKVLGTHALQLLFLGISGFRFPIAHFISDGIQAPELYPIFWEAVDKLSMYGFKTVYTCMDGAQSNRTFMKTNIGPQSHTFISNSPCSFNSVIFMMDFSHVMKKIRNNILKSGILKTSTRTLTLISGHTVQWQMFIDAYKWDKTNALQLHRRLTNEHMYLSNQSKMRNHLAEDVLNSEMLNLILQYQQYLGEKGEVLNGVIEILQNSSKLIEIFRDMRPIKTMDDSRLSQLKCVADWFRDWETYSLNNESVKKGMRTKNILSAQCHEDIQSCIIGFLELCKMLTVTKSLIHITPGLVNSDVVENLFNQQRSTYNGANTNPNALQYRRSLNSIMLGQNIVSQKANAGKNHAAAAPFNCTFVKPPKKRQPSDKTSTNKDIKVKRM